MSDAVRVFVWRKFALAFEKLVCHNFPVFGALKNGEESGSRVTFAPF